MYIRENLQNENKVVTALKEISPSWVQTNLNYFPGSEPNEFFDAHFNLTKFNLALNSRNSKSASNPDGINYGIIKNLPVKYKLILLYIKCSLQVTIYRMKMCIHLFY